MKTSPKSKQSPKTKSPSLIYNGVSLEEILRVARRAYEASHRQPKMTTEEMREQVRRNEIEWQSSRE